MKQSSTIKILNPSNYWTTSRPKFMRVARPYTEEWCRQKKNDWFFRVYHDFIALKDKGWTFWSPTLTYNNENLPSLQINDFIDYLPIESTEPNSDLGIYIPDSEIVPCFSKDHVTLFTKELRIYLDRLGYNTKGLKYLICSEFGEKRHRPHLHSILAVPDIVPFDVMLDVLRKTWHYGWVGMSKLGLQVTNAYAIRYATKYVVKDLAYSTFKFPSGRTIEDYIRKQDAYDEKDFRKILSPFMPRLYCSKGIGSEFFNQLLKMPESKLLNLCLGNEKINLPLGDGLDFMLPRYYINKMCYSINIDLTNYYGRVIAELTDFGKLVERCRFQNKVDNCLKKLNELDFNVCSGVGCLPQFYKVNRFDKNEFAWYYSVLRYYVPIDSGVSRDYIMANRQMILNDMLENRENVYLCDFLYYHGLVDDDWLAKNSSCSLFTRPLMCEPVFHPARRWFTLSEMRQFKDLEDAACAFDEICDAVFDKKECKKRNKRLQVESDKFDCLVNNPSLYIEYESIKDFEVSYCDTSLCR